MVFDVPEQIALGDGARVLAPPGKHRDGGIPVVLHLLQGLAQGEVVIDEGHILLGGKEEQQIHIDASLIVGLRVGDFAIIL